MIKYIEIPGQGGEGNEHLHSELQSREDMLENEQNEKEKLK